MNLPIWTRFAAIAGEAAPQAIFVLPALTCASGQM
jgi:hypothetical protein